MQAPLCHDRALEVTIPPREFHVGECQHPFSCQVLFHTSRAGRAESARIVRSEKRNKAGKYRGFDKTTARKTARKTRASLDISHHEGDPSPHDEMGSAPQAGHPSTWCHEADDRPAQPPLPFGTPARHGKLMPEPRSPPLLFGPTNLGYHARPGGQHRFVRAAFSPARIQRWVSTPPRARPPRRWPLVQGHRRKGRGRRRRPRATWGGKPYSRSPVNGGRRGTGSPGRDACQCPKTIPLGGPLRLWREFLLPLAGHGFPDTDWRRNGQRRPGAVDGRLPLLGPKGVYNCRPCGCSGAAARRQENIAESRPMRDCC